MATGCRDLSKHANIHGSSVQKAKTGSTLMSLKVNINTV